jgi:hypothetical protein
LILSLSQFLLLPQLPKKIKLASKLVKFDSKIIISPTRSESGNTNLLVGGSITVPSTSRQTGLELAVVDVNKKFVV